MYLKLANLLLEELYLAMTKTNTVTRNRTKKDLVTLQLRQNCFSCQSIFRCSKHYVIKLLSL